MKMFFCCSGKYQSIILVYHGKPLHPTQYDGNQRSENAWRIRLPKMHHKEIKLTHIAGKGYFLLVCLSRATFQYPGRKSRVDKQVAFPKSANISSVRARGTANGLITAFNCRRTTENLWLPLGRSRGIWIIQSPPPPIYLSQLLPPLLSGDVESDRVSILSVDDHPYRYSSQLSISVLTNYRNQLIRLGWPSRTEPLCFDILLELLRRLP